MFLSILDDLPHALPRAEFIMKREIFVQRR